jgi:predicted dehydrogenase
VRIRHPPITEVTTVRKPLHIATVGFGWMGQAHSRSYRRIPSLFPERTFEPHLTVCADNVESRRTMAVEDFGYARAVADWQEAVADPSVDVVVVCAPNMLHEEVCVAALAAGKHVFCEKPVGGTPPQTARVAAAARGTTAVTGVGYNYRWAPLVLHAKSLIDSGRLGTITNYRGRFFSVYGADPLGLLSWRFLVDQSGYGVSSDIMSHSIDLAMFLIGPITSLTGTSEIFIKERPLPKAGGTHYDRGAPGDPTGTVTNEDYSACMVRFANGAHGTFEASRSMVGPESQMAFEVYGTKGALSWNLETMNELQVFLVDDEGKAPRGYTTVRAGDRYPYHGHFVPGDANSIGFEDLVTIEDFAYLTSVAAGTPHRPGFEEAVDYVSVQDAWLRSCASGRWEDVVRIDGKGVEG